MINKIKKIVLSLLMLNSLPAEALCEGRELRIQVARKDNVASKTNVALVLTTKHDLLDEIVHVVQRDLAQSGQCIVALQHAPLPHTKQELETYYAAGYQFVVFLGMSDDGATIIGRLYDALDTSMMQGKKWQRREPLSLWAHKISQDLWEQLMGNPGSFASHIVYVKRIKGKTGKQATQLCLTHWDGSNEKVLARSGSILVAPSWKSDGDVIFCSQFTNRNVRLIATDIAGKSWIVLDRDGTTMGASSLAGCPDVVYCHSGEIWKCSYDPRTKRSTHTLVVRDGTMCASPTLLAGGDIIYCAGGRIKHWRAKEGKSSLITEQGYCVGPAYHGPTNRVVYSQKVGKTMQLCIKDLRTGVTRQVTSGEGDKIDASWSPCGTYLVYCLAQGKISEIFLLNTIASEQRRISAAGDYCSCPAWSPVLHG